MSLDSDIQLLAKIDLFQGFDPEALRLLAFGAEARALGEGMQLYRNGAYSDGGYVIVSGSVDITSESNKTLIEKRGPGTLIAEMALITEVNHSNTATATEHTDLLKIPRQLFRRMLEEYPDIAEMLQNRVSGSLNAMMNELEQVRIRLDAETA